MNLKWNAILVDANPEYVETMKKTRPNAIIVHAGAGKKEEVLDFYPAGVLGGFVKSWSQNQWNHVKKELGTNFDIKKMIKVKILPLSKILKEHKMQVVDFMNLDAEGHELEVLQGIDWKWSKIRFIFIESYNAEIENYLKSQGVKYVVERNQQWGPDHLLRLVE
jgi:FkbM family methyltransferase